MKRHFFNLSLVLALVSFLMTGCSFVSSGNEKKSNNSDLKITWEYLRDLPNPEGFDSQIGVAGPLFGNIGNYVLIGGGANFPYKSVLDGGKKEIYSDLFLFEKDSNNLKLIKHGNFEGKTAYGSSISTKDGIYYVGGSSPEAVSNEIYYITLNGEKNDVEINKIGELPFTFYNGIAVFRNNSLYILTGKQDGKNSNELYKFDISSKKIEKLANLPSEARSQGIGKILNDGTEELLYIFGGGTGTAYIDGWAYSFERNEWERKANVRLGSREISVLGGNSVKLNENELLVIGGFNKEIWDEANIMLGSLKGDELKKYKTSYFTKDSQDFNWNEEMLVYNAIDNNWRSLGKIPFPAPCGEGLIKIGNEIYSINGEIKPGVRSKKIYFGRIE